MKETRKHQIRTKFFGNVTCNRLIGGRFYRLTLELDEMGCEAFAGIMPGQFIEISLCHAALPPRTSIPAELEDKAMRQMILRRPFSFSDVRETDSSVQVDVLYEVCGPGTLRMSTLCDGNSVSILGPLGRGFSVPDGKTRALLVAGGMGAPPLQHMAGYLREHHPGMEVTAFVGAQTRSAIPFTFDASNLDEFARHDVTCHVATDDGSIGHKGFVTDLLDEWLIKQASNAADMVIFCCGPEGMLAEISRLADKAGIDCQVSMERMMACGIGLCQSCAVRVTNSGDGQGHYKLCCKDGPVFDSKEVVFE